MGDWAAELAALEAERRRRLRLDPALALDTLDDARAFLQERGLLTLTPDCALPSLFGAVHEAPYREGSRGFGAWPATRYWWGGALAAAPGVVATKLHRGRTLFLSPATAASADALGRAAVVAADEGALGAGAQRLVGHLAIVGPSLVEELREELELPAAELRRLRGPLEGSGALVARQRRVETASGHRHTSELWRWDQLGLVGTQPEADEALRALLERAVAAAVVAPRREVGRWFTFGEAASALDELVAAGRLRVVGDHVAAATP